MNEPTQQLIKDVAALKQKKAREELGLVLVEGRHPIEEAWRAGLRLKYWFAQPGPVERLPQEKLPPAYTVNEQQMGKMASTTSAPPCLAVFEQPAVNRKIAGDLILVLDGIQDPGNLGTLIRSAIAFGVDAIALTPDSVEPLNPKVIRASAGLCFAIPLVVIERESLLAQFGQEQRTLFVTTGQPGACSYREACYANSTAIVLGNEGRGVSDLFLGHPTAQNLTIPMCSQVESLNVGISGSIILAEAAAQRSSKPAAQTGP